MALWGDIEEDRGDRKMGKMRGDGEDREDGRAWGCVFPIPPIPLISPVRPYPPYLPTEGVPKMRTASFSFSQMFSMISVSGRSSNGTVTVQGLVYALGSSNVN